MSPFFLSKTAATVLLPALLSLPAAAIAQQASHAAPGAVHAAATKGSAATATQPQTARPLLPPDFDSQPREGDIVIQPTPADVDAAHADVLKEDGLVEAAVASYTASGAVGWKLQALRFGDATGALSAFTFYRDPTMQPETVGENAAAGPGMFLARTGATLVIVRAAGLTGGAAQNAAKLTPAMRALVDSLPKTGGSAAIPPTLPGLMPSPGLQQRTLHYAIGPSSYNGPLPVSAIDFARDAEVVTAQYELYGGVKAMLSLVMLPTPEIAGATVRKIGALPDTTLHAGVRRIGPLVGVVSGAGVSAAEAQQLLGRVHYASDITVNQPQGYVSEVAKTAKLLLSIGLITIFLGVASVVVAAFLGFGRLWWRRLRGKPDSSLNDDTFITLKL